MSERPIFELIWSSLEGNIASYVAGKRRLKQQKSGRAKGNFVLCTLTVKEMVTFRWVP